MSAMGGEMGACKMHLLIQHKSWTKYPIPLAKSLMKIPTK